MAIIKPFVIENIGISLEAAYFKITHPSVQEGEARSVKFNIQVYASKEARQSGKQPVPVEIGGLMPEYDLESGKNIYEDCYDWLIKQVDYQDAVKD